MKGRDRELWRDFCRAFVTLVLFVFCALVVADALRGSPALHEKRPVIIGIHNSNPGNIRSHNWKWWRKFGAVGVDPWKHLIFQTDSDGLRAIGFVLHGYKRHGLCTIEAIAKRWVGPSHASEAVRGRLGYMARLCQDLHAKPKQKLDMDDPRIIGLLARAIVYAENGRDPYPLEMYQTLFGFKEAP